MYVGQKQEVNHCSLSTIVERRSPIPPYYVHSTWSTDHAFKTPSHHGACSMLKIHWLINDVVLKNDTKEYHSSLERFPLFERNLWGRPCLTANRFHHRMNGAADTCRSGTVMHVLQFWCMSVHTLVLNI